MTRRTWVGVLLLALGMMLLVVADAVAAAGEVDPADIFPLANTAGWLLAVPGARLFGVALLLLACGAGARGQVGGAVVLVFFAGLVFIGPDAVRRVITHAALAGRP
jgi:Mn2+/Fe2+ NRAMP family transporter